MPFKQGDKLFIRTVTFHLVGEVTEVEGSWLKLKDAAWVADSGRFTQAIQIGALSEVEPVGDAWVNLNTATDVFPWRHDLPLEQK
jgi:hypothetical protein